MYDFSDGLLNLLGSLPATVLHLRHGVLGYESCEIHECHQNVTPGKFFQWDCWLFWWMCW